MILLMNVDKDNPSVAEGENVQIQGAGLTGFELKGNTHQDSYTGKNLFDINAITEGKYYWIDQNRIVDNANWNMSDYIKVNGNTNYIASYIKSTNKSQLNYSYYDENKNLLGGVGATSDTNDYSILTPANAYYIRLGYRNGGNYILSNIQLEQGSTATDFEKFVGGIPSPNPDYPQPIEVVTGDNTIKVHGKNLFDGVFRQGNRYTTGLNDTTRLFTTQNYPVKSGVSYTISTTLDTSIYKYAINLSTQIYPIPNTTEGNARQYYDSGWKQTNAFTFTPIKDGYLGIVVANQNGTSALTPSDISSYTFMLNEGDTALPYQPYQSQTYPLNLGSIELCKIGTYQDYIYKENNKWYKYSEIGKVVLDGSEEYWTDTPSGFTRFGTGISNMKVFSSRNIEGILSSHFIPNINNAKGVIYSTTGNICLYPTDNSITTTTQFKDWLSNNNVIIYYPLETPTNTEITDTELKEDLEAISNIALFEGVNNISMESSNLTSSFKVYYDTWYEFDKILRNGYNIREDRDRITQKFANGHRKQFVSDYVDCSITLNLDTIDKDTTQDYLQRLKSGAYKYYSIDGKEYRTAQFIIENKPELSVESSISNNVDVNEYQITLLKAGD